MSRRSRAQIHRDAHAGRLKVAQRFPGYNGPVLFDEDDVEQYAQQFEAAS